MPLYEYQCGSCQQKTEVIQKFSDPPLAECPSCGGPLRKLFSSPAIQFKGSGFYITDYGKGGSSATTPASSSSAAGSSSGSSSEGGSSSSEKKSSGSDSASASTSPASSGSPAKSSS